MKLTVYIFTIIFHILDVHSLIVPDEIPTILSVIYSNIPVLKKGTDSRLGWGFRLGNRADFQVLVELGPQQYTQPLANQGDNANSKRNTIDTLSNTLYAQRQKDKQISKTEGGRWLENWSKDMKTKQETIKIPPGARPGIAEGEIDAKSVIPEDSSLKLTELHNQKDNVEIDAKSINTQELILKLTKLYEQKKKESETTTEEIESTTLEESE